MRNRFVGCVASNGSGRRVLAAFAVVISVTGGCDDPDRSPKPRTAQAVPPARVLDQQWREGVPCDAFFVRSASRVQFNRGQP
jgi:hypothetical protein